MGLTIEEKRELVLLDREIKKRKAHRRLFDYTPYPKQIEFHANGATDRERLLMAGNQLGKCVLKQTLIRRPDGSETQIGELFDREGPFAVMAWDGLNAVPAMASRAIKKPAEPAVRIYLASGGYLDCALNHRVLTSRGYAFVSQLLAFVPCLPENNSARDPSIRGVGAPHSTGRPSGWIGRCFQDLRRHGARLLSAAMGAPGVATFAGDAPQHSLPASPWDDLDRSTRTNSAQPYAGRQTNPGGVLRRAARSAAFLSRAVCTSSPRTTWIRRAWRQLRVAAFVFPRSIRAALSGQYEQVALVSPSSKAGDHITAYRSIGVHDIYDMTVPGLQNYIAAGIVNHNTWSAGFETAMHLTGRYPGAGEIFYPDTPLMRFHGLAGRDVYPDGWQGKRFDYAIKMWAGSVSSEGTRGTVQKILIGEPAIREEWGTGAIPRADLLVDNGNMDFSMASGTADLIDQIQVKHISGDKSLLQLKHYSQGREKWQGATLDVVWFDEEPPLDIYMEGLTRTNATNGIVYLTFTPLLGMSEVVRLFISSEEELTKQEKAA